MQPAVAGVGAGLAAKGCRAARVAIVALLYGLGSQLACGQEALPVLGADVGVEQFRWEEWDELGQRLLKETGPRLVMGFSLVSPGFRTRGPAWRLAARATFLDAVDYDGRTNTGVPARGNVDYHSIQGDALFGYRDIMPGAEMEWGVFGGAGLAFWRRDINDVATHLGEPVLGDVEDYRFGYTQLSFGLFGHPGRRRAALYIGAKRPFGVREDEAFFGASLSPQARTSPFARFELELAEVHGPAPNRVTFYYDGYRFGRSADVLRTHPSSGIPVWVHQPKSELNVVGVTLTWY